MAEKITQEQRKRLVEYHKRIAFWGTPEKQYLDSGLWDFLSLVRTKDEHDPINPVKLLPEKIYIVRTFQAMLACPVLFVPKSRQIMISWMMSIFCCWAARTRKFARIMWQSKKEDDAKAIVSYGDKDPLSGRMSFIEMGLPESLRDPHICSGAGNMSGRLIFDQREFTGSHIPVLGRGSEIIAVPQGADQVRSYTPTLYVIDEAAFQEDFIKSLTTALPAVTGGGRIIAASSANPGDFADIINEGGRSLPGVEELIGPLPKGISSWSTPSKVVCLQIHYTADPNKDPERDGAAWFEEASAGYPGGISSPQWRREMEIDFEVMGGDPVFPFAMNPSCPIFVPRLDARKVRQEMSLYGGFDYGTRNPSAFVVWAFDRDGNAYAVWELYKPCDNYVDMAAEIKACPYFSRIRSIRADPTIWAKTQQRKSGKVSIADLFFEEGVMFARGNQGVAENIAHRFLGHYWADPDNPKAFITSACPNLRKEIAGLRWDEHRSQLVKDRKNNPEKIMDKNNHIFDATAYLFDARPAPFIVPDPPKIRGSIEYVEKMLQKEERRGKYQREYVRVV